MIMNSTISKKHSQCIQEQTKPMVDLHNAMQPIEKDCGYEIWEEELRSNERMQQRGRLVSGQTPSQPPLHQPQMAHARLDILAVIML
jgi:hypothetical protein